MADPTAGAGERRQRRGFLEYLRRAKQRHIDAPGDRDADRDPCENSRSVEPAEADADRTGARHDRLRRGSGRGVLSTRLLLDEPFVRDWADKEIGDQANDEKSDEPIKDRVVNVIAWDALGDPRIMEVVDQDWTDDAGRRPRREQATVDRADILRAEHIGEIGRYGGEAAAIH